MKKLTCIILLFFLAHAACFAQGKYSRENLEKSTQEELATYLSKAQKLKKSGSTVLIVGGSLMVVSAISFAKAIQNLFTDSEAGYAGVAVIGGFTSVVTLGVGLSMYITGRHRVDRIHSIRSSALNHVKMDLRPGVQYNFAAQNYQPGVVLRIRF